MENLQHLRCAQAKILHIAVDTQSEVKDFTVSNIFGFRKEPYIVYYTLQEGTVYIKTLSTEEAGKVFG